MDERTQVAERRGGESTLFLTRTEIRNLLEWDEVVQVVRETYVALALGNALLFPVVREQLPGGMFGLRSGVWPERELVGLKASGYFLTNRQHGMDNHQGCIVLLDINTGRPTSILDGNHVTWMRTAAAGLVGTLALAREDARRILVVGTGLQAEAQVRCHAWGLADRRPEFWVHEPLDDADASVARAFADRLSMHDIAVRPAPSLQDATCDSDIIITVTPATEPILKGEWLQPGTHLSAVGSDAPGKRELDSSVLQGARLIVDDREQAGHFGEAQSPVRG